MADRAQPNSIVSDLTRLGLAYVASTEDYWNRQIEVNARYLDYAISDAGSYGSVTPSGAALRDSTSTIGNYFMEMAMAPWLAAERFGAVLSESESPEPVKTMYFINEEDGWFDLNESRGAPVLLPTRVQDACQAQAIYAVSKTRSQAALDDRGLPFTVLDLGQDETAFVIFIVRYNEGDLGAYDEIGFGIYVTPRGQSNAVPGMYIMELPVNTGFAQAAGAIWGLPKTREDLTFETRANQVNFTFARQGSAHPLLEMTAPRGGSGASASIPHHVYTMKDGKPHRMTLIKSGRGEGSQTDGTGVRLSLGDEQRHVNDPLWKLLNDLQLTDKTPIIYQWTEHMSLEFGAARPIT